MAKLESKPTIDIKITLCLNEEEARAFHALTVYGIKSFLEVFYERMGRSALQPHESGIVSLFECIKENLPRQIRRLEKARAAFEEKEPAT